MCFASLAGFAIGVDMVHTAFMNLPILGYVEDGGEMISIAVACSCAFAWLPALSREPAGTGAVAKSAAKAAHSRSTPLSMATNEPAKQ
jgi:hypothetical protein